MRGQRQGQQLSHVLCPCSTSSIVQAVPHPEAGSISKELGELPPRAKTASAYFEVTCPAGGQAACWALLKAACSLVYTAGRLPQVYC